MNDDMSDWYDKTLASASEAIDEALDSVSETFDSMSESLASTSERNEAQVRRA
jgi:hypothetical protein